jgi:hypothetical protein
MQAAAAQGPPPGTMNVHSGGWNNSPPPNNMKFASNVMSFHPQHGQGPAPQPGPASMQQQQNSFASLAFQSTRPSNNMNQAPYSVSSYNSGGRGQMQGGNNGLQTVPMPFGSINNNNSGVPLSGNFSSSGPTSANNRPVETVPLPFGSINSGGGGGHPPQGTRPVQTVPLPFGSNAPQKGGQGAKPPASMFKSIAPPRKTVVLQPGETLEFTSRGVPYIKKQNQDMDRPMLSLDPSQEHKAAELSCFASNTKIAQAYGGPVIQYFNFLKFIICANVVFTCIGFISYGHHLSKNIWRLTAAGVGPSQISGTSALDVLFISTYQPSSDVSFCRHAFFPPACMHSCDVWMHTSRTHH